MADGLIGRVDETGPTGGTMPPPGMDAEGSGRWQHAVAEVDAPRPGADTASPLVRHVADTLPGEDGGRLQVPGPGPVSSFFGVVQTAPPSSAGSMPGMPGVDWQLDRRTGTLGFYARGADGGRTQVRSLGIQGDQVVAPNGQVLGRTHTDGGFELEPAFAAELATCPLPAGPRMSPMPPFASAPPLASAPPGDAARPQRDALGRVVSPRASVRPPGECSPSQWRRLQADVDNACKSAPRACTRGMPTEQLHLNLERNLACGVARDRINSQCFAGGDLGHRRASIEAWLAAGQCTTELHR